MNNTYRFYQYNNTLSLDGALNLMITPLLFTKEEENSTQWDFIEQTKLNDFSILAEDVNDIWCYYYTEVAQIPLDCYLKIQQDYIAKMKVGLLVCEQIDNNTYQAKFNNKFTFNLENDPKALIKRNHKIERLHYDQLS